MTWKPSSGRTCSAERQVRVFVRRRAENLRIKDEVVAQYALTGYDQPIGISDYQLSKVIPEKLKSALPSVEEVEEELASFLDKDNNTQK